MKRVFSSSDPTVVELVRGLLWANGIESRVFNEISGNTFGMVASWAEPEIWILDDGDEEQARQLVREFYSGALTEGTPAEAWICPDCGAYVEGQFTDCWRCAETCAQDEAQADSHAMEDPYLQCARCGYLLVGLPDRVCPACGEPV